MVLLQMLRNWKARILQSPYFKRRNGIVCDKTVRWEEAVRVLNRTGQTAKVGEYTRIHRGAKIVLHGADLTIGKHCMIGENNRINVFAPVQIGDNVITADGVSFITNTHNYQDIHRPIVVQAGSQHPISVGDGCWIGVNAVLLDGTTLGKNCVVAAGAVVKGQYPDFCVLAGVPARIIKQYDPSSESWVRVKQKGEHEKT